MWWGPSGLELKLTSRLEAVPRGAGPCPHCQAPAPEGGDIHWGWGVAAAGQPLQPPCSQVSEAAEENVA